jgi:hypothetical protein
MFERHTDGRYPTLSPCKTRWPVEVLLANGLCPVNIVIVLVNASPALRNKARWRVLNSSRDGWGPGNRNPGTPMPTSAVQPATLSFAHPVRTLSAGGERGWKAQVEVALLRVRETCVTAGWASMGRAKKLELMSSRSEF